MRKILISLLKRYKFIYKLYYYAMSFALKSLSLFISRDGKKEILFVCYGGRRYGDNVRPIYEMMLHDSRFNEFRFNWAFIEPRKYTLPDAIRTQKVKIDTVRFYVSALRSKCWITNVSAQRGLNFKPQDILYCNTWHGVPLKKIGNNVKGDDVFSLQNHEDFDLFFSEGLYDAEIYAQAFNLDEKKVCITGYPRNDVMFDEKRNIEMKKSVLLKYGIPNEKKIILYAPTYRDYNQDLMGRFVFEIAFSFENFDKKFHDEYILLVRAHGAIDIPIAKTKCIIDVSDYPDIEDLLVASDILITDYSGIMFDFSLLGKPILCYLYDLEKYIDSRGLYVDVETFLPFHISHTEKELFDHLSNIDYKMESIRSAQFAMKCGLIHKGATENVVDKIAECL